MKFQIILISVFACLALLFSCGKESANQNNHKSKSELTRMEQVSAEDILGNPNYRAISYGGYRQNTREIQPTIEELKEDMNILHAMGIRILRTYNVHFAQAIQSSVL